MVFTVEKITSDPKTPAFKMEFGLIASPLESRGYFMIVVYINRADLPFHSEPCKQHKVTLEVELNPTCCLLGSAHS